jgi:hypothetical protein
MDDHGSRKRGRKPGSTAASARERAQRKLAELEKARSDLRRLDREAEQRTALIVGRAVLAAAESDDQIRDWARALLKTARLSARDRAEIAHLMIDDADEQPDADTPQAAASAFASR